MTSLDLPSQSIQNIGTKHQPSMLVLEALQKSTRNFSACVHVHSAIKFTIRQLVRKRLAHTYVKAVYLAQGQAAL